MWDNRDRNFYRDNWLNQDLKLSKDRIRAKYLKWVHLYIFLEPDELEITFGEKVMKFKINEIREHVLKNDAKELYEQID